MRRKKKNRDPNLITEYTDTPICLDQDPNELELLEEGSLEEEENREPKNTKKKN